MVSRRRFMELFTGGIAAAVHGGISSLLLKHAAADAQALDMDGDFSVSFMGLLVNARAKAFQAASINWTGIDSSLAGIYRPVWPPFGVAKPSFTNGDASAVR